MFCLRFCWICIGFFLLPQSVLAIGINEFVPNASVEWVELYNASDSAEYLKQYFIDDDQSFTSDSGSGTKKALTNLNVTNVTHPYFEVSSFFNNAGDWVVLFDPKGAIIDQYQYDEDPGSEISLGRSPDATGTFAILRSATKGSQNDDILLPTPTHTPTSAPTQTPTPNPTATASPTNTSTPTPGNTLVPTKKQTPTLHPTRTYVSDILGIQNVASEDRDIPGVTGADSEKISTPSGRTTRPLVFSLLLVGIGTGFLSVALALQKTDIWKKMLGKDKKA